MLSLTDLCLTTIEESGSDTRELSDLNLDLPKRMWTRHPTFNLKGSFYLCLEDETPIEAELVSDIEVTYTGVYTLTCHIHVEDAFSEDELKKLYTFIGMTGPIKYEKTFESLVGLISEEHLKWLNEFLRTAGQEINPMILDDHLAIEILYVLLNKGKASYVNSWFLGKMDLEFPEWCIDEYYIMTIRSEISERLKFISAYMSV